VIVLLWLWWDDRNKGRSRASAEIAYSAAFQADRLLNPQTMRTLSEIRQRIQWVRPLEGVLKINTDGTFKFQSRTERWRVRFCHQGCPGRRRSSHSEIIACHAGLITETKFLISSEFNSRRNNACKRACNKVAHALATVGCSLPLHKHHLGSCTSGV